MFTPPGALDTSGANSDIVEPDSLRDIREVTVETETLAAGQPVPGWKRNVAIFLATQAISLFGSALVQLAIAWHITLSTQSGSMMAITVLCGFLPTFLISPLAGVWADRYDRRLLIVIADSVIALCTLALAIVWHLGYEAVWLLFVASAIRALGGGIQMPAVNALVPQFVPQEHLSRVNAINGTIQSTMTLLSPMVSALLLTIASLPVIFLVDVVTAAVAVAILLSYLRVPPRAPADAARAPGYFGDLREGVAYIRRHGFLKAFFLFSCLIHALIGPQAFLAPLQVARTYGEEVWRLSAIEVAFSLGMVLGGLLVAWWGGFRNKLHSMVVANLAFGVGGVIYGLAPAFVIYVGTMVIVGLVFPLYNTAAITMLQQRVEDAFLGRIFGVNTMIFSSLMPLSMLAYGPLADVVSVEALMLVTGVLIALQTPLMLGNRALKEAGAPASAQAASSSG